VSRIRSIKPDFWSSREVMALPRDARLLFIGIWNFADDFGRFKWDPETIRVQVFPGDKDIDEDTVAVWMQFIADQSLLFHYEDSRESSGGLQRAREKTYGWVTGWHHQRVSHPSPSKLPNPLECSEIREDSGEIQRIRELSRLIRLDPPRSAKRETASLLAGASTTAEAKAGHGQPKAKAPRKRTERDDLLDAFTVAFDAAHKTAHGVPHGVTPSLASQVVTWSLGIAPEERLATMQRAIDGFFSSEHWAAAGKHPLHAFAKAPGSYVTAAPATKPVLRWVGGMP
jgi:hypothetical protein